MENKKLPDVYFEGIRGEDNNYYTLGDNKRISCKMYIKGDLNKETITNAEFDFLVEKYSEYKHALETIKNTINKRLHGYY